MKSSRPIYIIMLLVFVFIVAGLVYRLTKDKETDNTPPETHTGYPY